VTICVIVSPSIVFRVQTGSVRSLPYASYGGVVIEGFQGSLSGWRRSGDIHQLRRRG